MLYDLVTEVVHVLNPSAGLVWASCDGITDERSLAQDIAEVTGVDRDTVAADVNAGIEQLRAAGLVARTDSPPPPPVTPRAEPVGSAQSEVHAVLDDGVRFHGDPPLLDHIDEALGLGDDRPATVELSVQEQPDGTVLLSGWGEARTYGSRGHLLDSLPSLLNLVAAETSTCVALHAAGVRSTRGEVVVIPATSGSGKSTLAGALVRSGWDYAGDEAVGVRAGSLVAVGYPKPLVLDLDAQALLHVPPLGTLNIPPAALRADVRCLRGDVDPISRVVLPRFDPGSAVSADRLAPRDAVVAIIEHALNLARVGEPGLVALCQLAAEAEVWRLAHGDASEAAAYLA